MTTTKILVVIGLLCLAGCGGNSTIKPAPASPTTNKSATMSSQTNPATSTKPGGYYLDDGPGDNPPKDIDSIPNAVPKKEPLLDRANKPYKALDAIYTPMISYQPYKERGVA